MAAPAPRAAILEIEAYVPGRAKLEGAAPARTIKLSANENALGSSPKAIDAYKAAADEISRYPDGASTALREALGKRFNLDPARLVCGCGSGDLLLLLSEAYARENDEVLHSAHGFLLYPIAARAAGAKPVPAPERDLTVSVDELLARANARTKLVYIANPNNPTGTYLPRAELRRLRSGLRADILLVIDSAYGEFARAADYAFGHELVAEGGNTVVARTFSKFFGLAGLRLGWADCPPAIADVLNRIRGPFNVALPTQAAAIAALEDRAFQDMCKAHNDRWIAWFMGEVRKLGLEVPESQANFVLVRFPAGPGRDARAANAFLESQGIIARQLGAYGLPDSLRITIGTEADMRATRHALAAFMGR